MPLSKIVAKSITDNTITTDQIADTSVHGRRNLVDNSTFSIAQRGTSITSVGVDTYSLDRWKQWASSGGEGGRATVTQEAITDLANISTAMKIQVTTADTSVGATDAYAMMQRLEAQDILHLGIGTSNSKSLTLSFYAKAPTGGGTYCAGIAMSGGGKYLEEVTIGTSWQRHEITIPATTNSSHATTSTGTTTGLQLFLTLVAGTSRDGATSGAWDTVPNDVGTTNQTNFYASTSNNLFITGFQLEASPQATPLEQRPFTAELHRCKRYFQKSFNYATAPENGGASGVSYNGGLLGYSGTNNNGALTGFWQFSPEMRSTPTITRYGNSSGHWGYMSAPNSSTSFSSGSGYISNAKASGINFGQNISGNTHIFGFGHATARAEP